jgi:hypothetical protein
MSAGRQEVRPADMSFLCGPRFVGLASTVSVVSVEVLSGITLESREFLECE